jgi:hypothetical protein
MASKPMEKGKRLKSYNNVAGVMDKPTLKGSEEGKATMSWIATAPGHPDWITLWSGARIEQRGATETLLELTIETTDGALTTLLEAVAKTKCLEDTLEDLGQSQRKWKRKTFHRRAWKSMIRCQKTRYTEGAYKGEWWQKKRMKCYSMSSDH